MSAAASTPHSSGSSGPSGPPRPVARQAPGFALLIVLAGLGMVGPFSIDTVFPAFDQLGRELGVGTVALQQLLSVYLLAFAVMSLLHGALSDALGRKPVILAGVTLYVVASVGCALSTSLGTLLAFRALQGMSAGAGQIISRAMVRDLYDGDQAQRVMSHIAMIFGLAPAIAPVVGGLLLGWTDWRGIFWFLAALGLALILLTALVLPETHPAADRYPLRVRPLAGSLWSVWRNRNGRRLALGGMLNFAGMFLYVSSAAVFVVGLLRLGEADFWVLFVPLIGGLVIGSFASGRLAGRMTGRRMATMGYLISLAGAVANLGFTLLPGAPMLPWAVAALPVYTFGVAITFPIITLAMLDLFPDRRGAASSVQSFASLLFNALLAGVLSPLVAHSAVTLAAAAIGFTLGAWALWARHARAVPVVPVPDHAPAELEPLEEM